jgi:hypothetical protein
VPRHQALIPVDCFSSPGRIAQRMLLHYRQSSAYRLYHLEPVEVHTACAHSEPPARRSPRSRAALAQLASLQVCPSILVGTANSAAYGCPTRLSAQSKNRAMPFTPMLGIVGAVFALAYTPGPEKKPWDMLMGYPMLLGRMDTEGVMLANFGGATACGGVGGYALASHVGVRFYHHNLPSGSCHTGVDSSR